MALVFTPVANSRPDIGESLTDVTLDGTSYSSGFTISAANVRMVGVDTLDVVSQNGSAIAPVTFQYDKVNGKLRGYRQGAAAGVLTESVAGDYSTSMILRVRAKGTPAL